MTKIKTFIGVIGIAAIAIAIVPSFASAALLTRQLETGSRGSDVSDLQTFLARDPSIYPQGLVTGNFLSLTKAAVMNFQARNNISTVGRVGPITMAAINAQMSGNVSGNWNMNDQSLIAPTVSNVGVSAGVSSATVSWNTNEAARGVVYYSSSPLSTYELPHSVTVSGNVAALDTTLRTSQNVMLTGLSNNTTYHYMVYATDSDGNVSVSWPATFRTSN